MQENLFNLFIPTISYLEFLKSYYLISVNKKQTNFNLQEKREKIMYFISTFQI